MLFPSVVGYMLKNTEAGGYMLKKKHRSYNLFQNFPTNFPIVPMAAI